jgi:hypothetical protein
LRNQGLVVCGFLYRCCPYWVESNNSLEDQRQRIKQRAEVGRSDSGVEIRRQAGRTVAANVRIRLSDTVTLSAARCAQRHGDG